MVWLAQNCSDAPASMGGKKQQRLKAGSVQSELLAQRRTVCVPEQRMPTEVAQLAEALHMAAEASEVQAGVRDAVAQQTGVEPLHPPGPVHAVPPASPASTPPASAPPPELEPLSPRRKLESVLASLPWPPGPAGVLELLHAANRPTAKRATRDRLASGAHGEDS